LPTAGVPADPTAEVPADLAADVPADLTASRAARHDITQTHSACLGKPLFCLMLRGSDEL